MNYPETRQKAKELNSKYYYTGIPCKRGHIALREVKGNCVECRKQDWEIDNHKRKDKPKSAAAKAAAKRYYEKNKDAVIARAQARPKEEVSIYKKKYKDNNPELYKALTNQRRKRFKDATPPWLTKEQKKEIRLLYLKAMEMYRITGEPYEVDHIIPINNPEVCGLHVPWNLRVITKEENLKKSNKLTY
jgi:hypothetical protein